MNFLVVVSRIYIFEENNCDNCIVRSSLHHSGVIFPFCYGTPQPPAFSNCTEADRKPDSQRTSNYQCCNSFPLSAFKKN